jgi:hypothetical protein
VAVKQTTQSTALHIIFSTEAGGGASFVTSWCFIRRRVTHKPCQPVTACKQAQTRRMLRNVFAAGEICAQQLRNCGMAEKVENHEPLDS